MLYSFVVDIARLTNIAFVCLPQWSGFFIQAKRSFFKVKAIAPLPCCHIPSLKDILYAPFDAYGCSVYAISFISCKKINDKESESEETLSYCKSNYAILIWFESYCSIN